MRDIKFRAKETDSGNWVYGYYWRTDDTTFCFKEDYDMSPNNTKHYILFDMMTDWGLPNRKLKADIIPETLGQYTGLKDKNRKEIFEGDIVEVSEEGRKLFGTNTRKYQLVGFKDGTFMTCRNALVKDRFDTYLWILKDYISIKGNAYDNKELLECE